MISEGIESRRFMTPEKRDALQKLREQELALDKQSFAIQSALARLDTAYVQHTAIGSSLYSSLLNRQDRPHRQRLNFFPPEYARRDDALTELFNRFTEHVAATNNFQIPKPIVMNTHNQSISYEFQGQGRSSDGNESFLGTDVLRHTQQQLSRIREQRASTLAQRLQQKQEALVAAEQARLDALHEVRHRAAMEIAGRHLLHRCCWAAVTRLYGHAKRQANLALAQYKWRVISMLSVLNRLVRYARINSTSEAPCLALRMRAGWRRFSRGVARLSGEHLLDLQGELVAQSFHARRRCRSVLLELFRSVHRKRMTAAKIDLFNLSGSCRRALSVMRDRLLGQHGSRLAREGKLLLVERRKKSLAFAELRQCALRGRRNHAIVSADNTDRAAHALHCLAAFARQSAHLSHCRADGTALYAEHALSRALRAWHSSTTLRAHRRYCAHLASRHCSDISRTTGSLWLRSHVRGFLRRWSRRVAFNRRRTLPLRHFKSRRYRQKVQALLRAWRLRVVKAVLTRKAERAKVQRLRLCRAWAWFTDQRILFSARVRDHKAALRTSRNLLRSKYLAEGFADFRAYVLENKAKRVAVGVEKRQQRVGEMASVLACLKARLRTRDKRRAAAAARLQVQLLHGFRRWRARAGLRLGARRRAACQRLRAERVGRGWAALRESSEARAARRVDHARTSQALQLGKRRAAWATWLGWTSLRVDLGAKYCVGKDAWRHRHLQLGMQQWKHITAATMQLVTKGTFKVRLSAARRTIFLHRWSAFVAEARAKRAHAASFARDRCAAQARAVLAQLQRTLRNKAEEAELITSYREHTLVPLLQSRFFRCLLVRREEAEARRRDPRLLQRAQWSCLEALRVWRVYRQRRRLDARSARLGGRNHAIVSSLQALAHWRNLTRLHSDLVEAARRAARQYRRKYYAPAFKNWLRNTAALAHQFDARYLKHGDLLKKTNARRVLAALRRTRALSQRLRHCAALAEEYLSTHKLRRGMQRMRTTAMLLRQKASRKKAAASHRALILKRRAFEGIRAHHRLERHYRALVARARAKHNLRVSCLVFGAFRAVLRDSETPGFGRACRHHAKEGLRSALSVLKGRLAWRHRSVRAYAHSKRHRMLQGLVALKQRRLTRCALKAEAAGLAKRASATMLRRYMSQWLSNRFARRAAHNLSVGLLRTKSLAEVWSFSAAETLDIGGIGGGISGSGGSSGGSGMSGGSRSPTARRVSAVSAPAYVSASSASSAPPRSPSPRPSLPSPLRRQSSIGSLSPGPAASEGRLPVLRRASSVRLVRRRSTVNPVSFAQQRRRAHMLSVLMAHTFRRKQERAELRRVEREMGHFRQHGHLAAWTGWVQDVVAEKLQVIQAALHSEMRLSAQLLPALRRILKQSRHIEGAGLHHQHSLLVRGWRRWAQYACTGLRRARAQAKAQQRAREREASQRAAPQFLDDDFSHRRSSLLGSPGQSAAAGPGTTATNPTVGPKDHRVTVQRARLQHAEVMHLLHSATHALARWRHWSRLQYHHRKLVFACLHRQLENVLRRLQQHLLRAKERRATLRAALKWRRHYQLRHSFASLQQNRHWSRASRQLLVQRTGRIFQAWRLKVRFRGRAKHRLLQLEDIRHTRVLQGAWAEWRADTAVETALLQGLQDLRRHRLHHGVDHLVYRCKVRRRSAALQLRSRKYKTHRLLHRVFENILTQMSVHYRSVEVLRDCARFHLRYHCRRVLYNLFYLRRNRIAKDHNLARCFRDLLSALRLNKIVSHFDKANMARANAVIMRKTLWALYRKAKLQKATARRLRALQPHHSDLLHHSVALVALCRRRALQRVLRRLRTNVSQRRKQKKQLRRSAFACMERGVQRSFRLLLSHCRRGHLRRRNSQALYALFVNLQLRRAVSRLDVNVSHKWALQQEHRLMHAYSVSRDKGRALRLLLGTLAPSVAAVGHGVKHAGDGEAGGSGGQDESKEWGSEAQ